MIEAPVCFNSLRRRAEALFFYEQKEKGLLDKQKEEEKIFNKEDCFFETKEKGESFSAFSERFIRKH